MQKLLWMAASLALPLVLLAKPARAQMVPDQNPSAWTLEVGGGVNPTLGETKGHLDTGGHFLFGAGYRLNRNLDFMAELQYTEFGVDQSVLIANNVPAGDAHLWSFSLTPRLRLSRGRVSPYVLAGVGFYHRYVEFTQPTTATTFVFDPWWGYIGPALVPANVILGSATSNAFGGNAGLGVDIRLGQSMTKLFLEARLHYANTRGRATEMLPITIGLRW